MSLFLYILIGFAIGFEVGRQTAGKKLDWKKSLITGLIALAVGFILVKLIG